VTSELKRLWQGLAMNNKCQWLLFMLFMLPVCTYGHSSSEAYLSLQIKANQASGAWEFSLRDLEYVVGVDANGDGKITWNDIKQRETAIQQYILSGVHIIQREQACSVTPGETMLNNRQDTVFLHLPIRVVCADSIEQLTLQYQLFFSQDIRHHAIWTIASSSGSVNRISSANNRWLQVDLMEPTSYLGFKEFVSQGIWHIWIGLDHILFLILLMLAVENSLKHLQRREHNRQRWLRVIKTVTAFTLAHSVTLALATTGWFMLPTSWVESAIALSVILAGFNVLFKWVNERLWLFAFGFGLIHGFGFASVLLDLGLQKSNLLLNLLAFNLGVELGQLVIVVLAIPVIAGLGKMNSSGIFIRHTATAGVIMLASVWFVQRIAM